MCFCLALLFPTTLDPVHNSLEDSPCDVQNRPAEQHVLQHARIPFSVNPSTKACYEPIQSGFDGPLVTQARRQSSQRYQGLERGFLQFGLQQRISVVFSWVALPLLEQGVIGFSSGWFVGSFRDVTNAAWRCRCSKATSYLLRDNKRRGRGAL